VGQKRQRWNLPRAGLAELEGWHEYEMCDETVTHPNTQMESLHAKTGKEGNVSVLSRHHGAMRIAKHSSVLSLLSNCLFIVHHLLISSPIHAFVLPLSTSFAFPVSPSTYVLQSNSSLNPNISLIL
jgi:hypothetical protein